MSDIFAFAETRGGELRKVALETVTAARSLADATGGGAVHALVAGASGVAATAPALARYGADIVLVLEHPALEYYNPEALSATVAERVRGGGYRAALLGATVQGRDLAPRVAARLGVPLASDVTAFEVAGDTLEVRHPMYTGKVIGTLALRATPALLALRPNVFTPAERPAAGAVETLASAVDPAASRVRVTELSQGNRAALDLSEAPVVVSGGRGLKAAENFRLAEDLASAFGNAAVGATRAVTDEGWRPHSDQIGQTGRTVSPELYVALGISGAIQHLAGMRTSRTIVAVNKDKDAPIFKIADYGIVGDVLEVVPVLTDAVRRARQGS